MVVLNKFIPVNILSLKKHISNKFIEILKHELDFVEIREKEKIFSRIIKSIESTISSDYFIYLIIDDDYCTHKYKRGKKEGCYCVKKIRNNNNIKKNYLCSQHDPNHVPIPRKKNLSKFNPLTHIDEGYESDKTHKVENNINKELDLKNNSIDRNDRINREIKDNNKNAKIHIKRKKNNNNFKNKKICKYYEKGYCKYGKKCKYMHKNKSKKIVTQNEIIHKCLKNKKYDSKNNRKKIEINKEVPD